MNDPQTIIDRETVADVAYRSDASIREDYPFGPTGTCFAITGHDRQSYQFFVELVKEGEYDLAIDLIDCMRWDNLGFEKVFYFPRFTLAPPDGELDQVEEMD